MTRNPISFLELNHENTLLNTRPPKSDSIAIERDRRTTFRISKIPVTVSKPKLLSILDLLFSQTSCHGQPAIPGRVSECSIAPSPMDSGRYQIATVTFESIPTQLQACGGSEEWVSLTARIDSTTTKLVFDSHFIGLTPLQGSNGDYQVDLVFVTGLAGHAFGSWKARGEHTMWVRDFLVNDLEYRQPGKTRVLTYGYDTRLLASSSTAGIDEFACSLLDAVKNARRFRNEQVRPIIFVAHSLGGLVVKKALLQASTGTERDRGVSRSVHACFFLGVPHRGMNNEQLKYMVKGQPNEALISDLGIGSQFLKDLERSFNETFTLDSLRVFSIYETSLSATVRRSPTGIWGRTGPKVEMVTKESALDWLDDDRRHTRIPRNVDHSTLAKFTSNADHDYEVLRCHILECVEEAVEEMSKRLSEVNDIFADCYYDGIPTGPLVLGYHIAELSNTCASGISSDVASLASLICLRLVVDSLRSSQCEVSIFQKEVNGDEVPVNRLSSVEFTYSKTMEIECSTHRKIDVGLPPHVRTQVNSRDVRKWPQRLGRTVSFFRRSLKFSLNAKTRLLNTILQAKEASLDISRHSVPRSIRWYLVGKKERLTSTHISALRKTVRRGVV